MLPMFLAIVDQTIVAAALPAIAGDLGSAERVSWVVIAYLVSTTIAAPVYGRLGDVFGRRRMLFVALFVMIGASILCGLAPSVELLTAFRVLQGFGGGGLMTLSQALVGEAVPPRTRARYQGFLATVGVSSNAFGAVAGGLLTEHFGWRSVFFAGVPIAILAIVMVRRLPARAPAGEPFRFDWWGLLLFTVFVSASLVALHTVQRFSIDIALLIAALLLISVAAVVLLIWRERRAPYPLLPISLLRNPVIWRTDSLAACHGASLVALITFLPIYLRVVHDAAVADIGFLLLPLAATVALGSIVTGWLVSWSTRTMIFPSVGLMVAVVAIVVQALLPAESSLLWVSLLLATTGLAMGTVMGVVQVTVQAASGAMIGAGAGSVQFSRSLGAALGTALVGTVLFSRLASTDADAAAILVRVLGEGPGFLDTLAPARVATFKSEIADAFRIAFLTVAGLAALGSALAWSIPQRRL
jgi:MFS family permease